MKKMIHLILALIILCGCSSGNFTIDELKPGNQNTHALPLTAAYENGFYFVSEDYSSLYYAENCEQTVFINDLVYNDDHPVSEKSHYEKYTDSVMPSAIYVNGGSIYYISHYMNVEGDSSFRMYAMSADGRKRKEIMDFPYQPGQFILHKNRILCVEYSETDGYVIHVYDEQKKELNAVKENGPVYHLFADGNYIYYETQDVNTLKYRICRYDIDLNKAETAVEIDTGALCFESGGKIAYEELSQPFLIDTDPMDITVTSRIVESETMKTLFMVEDERIDYFDEESVYTSSIKESRMVYRIYDWDGGLKKTIVPSDTITGESLYYEGWVQQDYSGMIHIVNGKIIARSSQPEHYIACETESGMCRVIHE
ncbi:MAG: hypothetical protein Q4C20_15415 [Erysipelotrichaceae bacterium]|nr:hypothetical protein [Erysipelotrichaceae bacterium]